MGKAYLEIIDFTVPNGTVHQSTDWQLDDDQAFSAPILVDDSGNTVNLLDNSITHTISGQYYGRARINLDTGSLGWLSAILFSNPNIPTPRVFIDDTDQNTTVPTIRTSSFLALDGSTHSATDWIIVDTSTQQTIHIAFDDTINLTSLSTNGLGLVSDTTYRCYARFKATTGVSGFGVCEFTCNVSKTIEIVNTTIVTVSITGGPNNVSITPTISVSPTGIAGHTATDWIIIDRTTGQVVWESLNNTTNLTSITVPTPLVNNKQYTAMVRYKINNLYTDYGRYDFTTVSSANIWTSAANYPSIIAWHTQSTLSDGRVLVVGGSNSSGATNQCYLYDPTTNTWSPAANYPTNVYHHTQSTLSDGRVLVVGGSNSSGNINQCYLYDPATDTWTSAANYPSIIAWHTQSTLSDGRVLVVGGSNNTGITNQCYIYDPTTDTWSPAANYPTNVYYHTQSTLSDGRVLVVGGHDSINYLNNCYVYDPATDTWSPAANYPIAVIEHTQSTLLDGRVLVVGGNAGGISYSNSCYLYDPATNIWTAAANYPSIIAWHTQSTLSDGRVLVVGGNDASSNVANTNYYVP